MKNLPVSSFPYSSFPHFDHDRLLRSKILIWHNILWSHYKGALFSDLAKLTSSFFVIQVAETETQRTSLSSHQIAKHRYPYLLLFKCSFENIPCGSLITKVLQISVTNKATTIVINGFHEYYSWIVLCVAIFRRQRIVLSLDSTLYEFVYRPSFQLLKRIFISRCDSFLTYGERSTAYLLSLGAKPSRIFQRVLCAYLPDNYDANDIAESISEKSFSLEKCLFVGRLSPEKNIDRLLNAIKLVKSAGISINLTIIGAGPLLDQLNDLVGKLGISQNVTFLGSLPYENIVEYYKQSSFLILPSVREPWGLVVNEAMHHGCIPLISSRCGSYIDLIHNRYPVSISSFDPEFIESISNVLVAASRLPSIYFKGMASRNLSFINESFSCKNAAKQLLSCLEA